MKKGDFVNVNWPTGIGGPYKVVDLENIGNIPIIEIDDEVYWVDPGWCEPTDPPLEPVRRQWDELSDEERRKFVKYAGQDIYRFVYDLITGDKNVRKEEDEYKE